MWTRALVIALGMGSTLAVGVLSIRVAGLAAAQSQSPAIPLIASVQVSADLSTLTISGLNLVTAGVAGTSGAAPNVSLALTPLPITASSATVVTSTLPSGLGAGTYLLLLSRSDGQAATFYVTVGAVGPQGPPGPTSVGGSVWQ